MSTTKLWYLEKFDFMKKLCKDEKIHLEKAMVMKKVSRNAMLHFPEMKEKYIYFLKEGLVKIVHYNEEGKESIKYLISPGNIFGELALLENQEDSNDYAVAMDDCVICFMKAEEMNMMMQENKDLNINVRKLIGLRLKRIERRLESLIFKDVKTRILEFLIELANDFGKPEGNKIVVKNFLTHDEIAKLTATSRQTVTSTLLDLRESGTINYTTKFIEFTNLKSIQKG